MLPEPQLRKLFAEALDIPTTGERARFLAEACGPDVNLRRQVEALLEAHAGAGSFLADPSKPMASPEGLTRLSSEMPGDKIGRYTLLQQVGEGGCGVVYVAEQTEPVRRRVALKVIKLGMDTRQVVARFEAERQALALMDHPNIAKVLDAGATETGRPYFVMELVRGIKITDYCDQNQLPTQHRLELFIKVCHAIQHAHQKGIIHRDIKPSNILVTLHDGVPVPKVIDFGIAKATEGRLADATVYTQLHQFIGTPAYMSPEQAEMSGLDVDTRSDIYSLGVLLYEMLTGRTPFDSRELMSRGLDEMRRIIREQEPVRPSTRLATLQGNELTTTAKRRSVEASRLAHLLRGDLDWIVMKCLEKDRTRRYETANGLAADLQRHLGNEPVTARQPSPLYRLGKFARRNLLAVSAATVTALALLLGTAVSTWQLARARRAEHAADRQRDAAIQAQRRSERINRFLTEDLLYQAFPEQADRGSAMTVQQLLDLASQRLEGSRDNEEDPRLEASLRFALGKTYNRLELYPEAERHLDRAIQILRRELGTNHWDTLVAQLELVTLKVGNLNQFDDRIQRLTRDTLQAMQGFFENEGPHSGETNVYRSLLDVESLYLWTLAHRGESAKAAALKRENTAHYQRAFGAEDRDTINELCNLSMHLTLNGEFDEAERTAEEAIARFGRIGKSETDDAYKTVAALVEARFFKGDSPGAVAAAADALKRPVQGLNPLSGPILRIQAFMARALADQGRLQEAEELARDTLLKRLSTGASNTVNAATSSLVLGRILVSRGRLDEAQPFLEQARDAFRQNVAPYAELAAAELAADSETWLGAIQLARGQPAKAEALMLPGARHYLARSLYLSAAEQRASIGHLVQLYTAAGKPNQAAAWQHRMDALRAAPGGRPNP